MFPALTLQTTAAHRQYELLYSVSSDISRYRASL